jgi:hypothetical protein
LADFLDSSPLKPFIQMNRNMVESIYGKSSVALEIGQSETRIACGGNVC